MVKYTAMNGELSTGGIELSRRQLLLGVTLGVGAAALGGCGADHPDSQSTDTTAPYREQFGLYLPASGPLPDAYNRVMGYRSPAINTVYVSGVRPDPAGGVPPTPNDTAARDTVRAFARDENAVNIFMSVGGTPTSPTEAEDLRKSWIAAAQDPAAFTEKLFTESQSLASQLGIDRFDGVSLDGLIVAPTRIDDVMAVSNAVAERFSKEGMSIQMAVPARPDLTYGQLGEKLPDADTDWDQFDRIRVVNLGTPP
jgi:hypothetical protein